MHKVPAEYEDTAGTVAREDWQGTGDTDCWRMFELSSGWS